MKSKKIIGIYESEIEKISGCYHILINDFDKDANHNFRTGIKKLRAFIRLVNTSQKDHPNKIPGKIKKFYRLAGDARNLQLHEQRISALCKDLLIEKPSVYLDCLHDDEKNKRKETESLTHHISFKDFRRKLLNDVPEELTEENKNEFVKNNMVRVAQLLMLPVYYDETFHDVRKVIKDIMYNYDYLEDAISFILPYPLNDLKFMENLADVLGDFHDLSLALFFLNPIHIDGIEETNEAALLAELKKHLQLRKEDLKNELLHLFTPVKTRL